MYILVQNYSHKMCSNITSYDLSFMTWPNLKLTNFIKLINLITQLVNINSVRHYTYKDKARTGMYPSSCITVNILSLYKQLYFKVTIKLFFISSSNSVETQNTCNHLLISILLYISLFKPFQVSNNKF